MKIVALLFLLTVYLFAAGEKGLYNPASAAAHPQVTRINVMDDDSVEAIFNEAVEDYDNLRYNEAIRKWHSTIAYYDTTNPLNVVIGYDNISLAYWGLKEFGVAYYYMEKAIDYTLKHDLQERFLKQIKRYGDYLNNLGYIKAAADVYAKAIKISEGWLDAESIKVLEDQLAVYNENVQVAADFNYTDFDKLLKPGISERDKYDLYINLGINLTSAGDYERARSYYNLALETIPKITEDKPGPMDALTGLFYVNLIKRTLRIYDPPETAQGSAEYDRVMFHMTDIEYITKDSAVAVVNAGLNENVIPGSEVEIWGMVTDQLPDHDVFNLAKGIVTEVDTFKSKIAFKLLTADQFQKLVFINDLVYLRVKKVKFDHASLLRDLAKERILFRNSFGNIFYDFFTLSRTNSAGVLELIKNQIDTEVKETADLVATLEKDSPSFLDKAKGGRFRGKTLQEALRASRSNDVEDFFLFVLDFPGKYLGLNWSFNEVYATWMLSECMIGYRTFELKLLDAKSTADLDRIFFEDSLSIIDNGLISRVRDTIEAVYNTGQADRAKILFDGASYLAEKFGRPELLKEIYLSGGLTYNVLGDYESAEKFYEKSLRYSQQLQDTSFIGTCFHNRGTNFTDMLEYEESIAMFDSAIVIRQEALKKDPTPFRMTRLGGSYWGKAYALVKLDKYVEGVKNYELAIALYDSSKTDDAFGDKVTVLFNIADTYTKMGELNKALELYQRLLQISIDMKDDVNIRKAYFNLAYTYFELAEYNKAIEFYTKSYELYLAAGGYADAINSLSNIGQANWNLGKYDIAIEYHMKALKLGESNGTAADQGYSWNKIAALYKESGEPTKAIDAYTNSIKFYEMDKDSAGIAKTYIDMAQLYKDLKDFAKSFELTEKAILIRERLNMPYEVAEGYFDLGLAYYDYREYEKATDFLKKSLELNTQLGDQVDQVYCLLNLGLIDYVYRRSYDNAIKTFTDALQRAKLVENDNAIAYSYYRMGNLFLDKGNTQNSFAYLDSSLTLYNKIGDKNQAAFILLDIGLNYIQSGEFEKAKQAYMRADTLAKETNNKKIQSSVKLYFGDLYSVLGDYKKAREYVEITMKEYDEDENLWGKASAHLTLGSIYNTLGEYSLAKENYDAADSIYISLEDEFSRATPINNIGTVFFWQGDYDNALSNFYRVMGILDSVKFGGEFLGIVQSNLGEVYLGMKKYDDAKKWLQLALQTSQKNLSVRNLITIQSLLAEVYNKLGMVDSASYYLNASFNKAKEIGEKDKIMYTAVSAAEIYYKLGDVKKSDEFINLSVKLSEELGTNRVVYRSYLYRALIEKDQNKADEAINTLRKAVQVLNDIRGKLIGGEKAAKLFSSGDVKVQIYETLINLFIQKGQIDSALYYLDLSYNEGLKEQMGKLIPKFEDENKNKKVELEKELKTKVEGLDAELEKEKSKPEGQRNEEKIAFLEQNKQVAEKEYLSFITETVKEYPGLAQYFSNSVNPNTFIRNKNKIPKDVAVLAYLMGEKQLYIFSASRDSVTAVIVEIPKSELEKKLVKYYKGLKDPSMPKAVGDLDPKTMKPLNSANNAGYEKTLKPFLELGMEFYDLLIRPVASVIKNKSKISIIPFGKLYYLPFETLVEHENKEFKQYFGSDKMIFYVTTLEVLTQNSDEEATAVKLMALGNADKTLPNAELEVEDLKELFSDAKIYLRDDASEDKIKNLQYGEYNALHLATHGSLDYKDIRNSFLALASNNPADDGKLTIGEVWSLTNLADVKLVTLSACKTAVSDEIIEGWLTSPANAFFDVGVQTVVASLWQVDDAATATLMKEFYSNLKSMPKLEALQRAKENLSKDPKYALPFFWGAFILTGNYK
ncbi:MAG: tetratricopeptide repeat protein [Ignavibacteriaceae bacterium]|nr:tetratricopeptide repeat protein [Ignavibacteriaceae bacterium]